MLVSPWVSRDVLGGVIGISTHTTTPRGRTYAYDDVHTIWSYTVNRGTDINPQAAAVVAAGSVQHVTGAT